VAEVVSVVRQVAEGLKAAHNRGLIHRDIKPANIWLEPDPTCEGIGRVKLLDFGLAFGVADPSLTATGYVVGTPHYMAPEQASGGKIDRRADLFALGCVAYAALTNELPFAGDSVLAVLSALANSTPPPAHTRNPAIPIPLSDLIGRLLSKDPAARPGSAGVLIAELDRIDGLPPQRGVVTPPPTEMIPPTQSFNRRRWLLAAVGLAVVGGIAAVLATRRGGSATDDRPGSPLPLAPSGEPIPVGVLHSETGTMALSERSVSDATQLAIDEVNAAGGVLGRPVRAVFADGKSDPAVFAERAEHLLTVDKVAAVFGCWTSASRKAVKPVVERHRGLLFYPVQYEGLEQSPWIVYLGPAPNQQLDPAVKFLYETLGKRRIFLIGSDYVYPRTAHEILKDLIAARPGASVVGERFVPLADGADVSAAVADIVKAKPDAIINTVNGGANLSLFPALRAAGVPADKVPMLSVSITENELRGVAPADAAGGYLVASYFGCVDTLSSRKFIAAVMDRYGQDRLVSDMMAKAYAGVHLWARAANAAGALDPTAVRAKVRGLAFDGPGGRLTVDAETQHTHLPLRIAQVQPDRTLKLVGGSDEPLVPVPYPVSRRRDEWERFLIDLNNKWGGRWVAPMGG
jgi:urea transport system substrate-binding protein